jgi:hypothetical protein
MRVLKLAALTLSWLLAASQSRCAATAAAAAPLPPRASPEFRPLHPAFRDVPALRELIQLLPKAELHIHIEGTLEVEMMFRLARRNGYHLPYPTPAAAQEARSNFTCLEVRAALWLWSTRWLLACRICHAH